MIPLDSSLISGSSCFCPHVYCLFDCPTSSLYCTQEGGKEERAVPVSKQKLSQTSLADLCLHLIDRKCITRALPATESGLVFYIDLHAKAGAATMEGDNGYWIGTSGIFHKKCERAIHPLTKKFY